MKNLTVLAAILLVFVITAPVFSEGPPEQNTREAYRMILSQADTNRDGKLSATECKAIYRDKKMAEKNCTFWDVNRDGTITEEEYVRQALSLGKKKR